jgi:hypothetical protein
LRRYLSARIPEGKPTYEEVFWARVGGLVLPVLLLGTVASDTRSAVWLAVGSAGYLCTPADNRPPAKRQEDGTDYPLPVAFGAAIFMMLVVVGLSTEPVGNAIENVISVGPTALRDVIDTVETVDVDVLVTGGIYGVFARTGYRWYNADEIRPPD